MVDYATLKLPYVDYNAASGIQTLPWTADKDYFISAIISGGSIGKILYVNGIRIAQNNIDGKAVSAHFFVHAGDVITQNDGGEVAAMNKIPIEYS